MDNPKKRATLGTQDTVGTNKQKQENNRKLKR
jgi:hypothetical protein